MQNLSNLLVSEEGLCDPPLPVHDSSIVLLSVFLSFFLSLFHFPNKTFLGPSEVRKCSAEQVEGHQAMEDPPSFGKVSCGKPGPVGPHVRPFSLQRSIKPDLGTSLQFTWGSLSTESNCGRGLCRSTEISFVRFPVSAWCCCLILWGG